METSKSHARREREGFFQKYMRGAGIDIGCGNDPVFPDCMKWDWPQGDAVFMRGAPPDGSLDWVYSSHCLEHLYHPEIAVSNWWRLLRPGGHLIIAVPHRDLYERKQLLPSRFNGDHKLFFLPDQEEGPHTFSLAGVVRRGAPDAKLQLLRVCDDGWVDCPPDQHAGGEYQIEGVWRR